MTKRTIPNSSSASATERFKKNVAVLVDGIEKLSEGLGRFSEAFAEGLGRFSAAYCGALKRQYRTTQNPLYVWAAYRACRAAKATIPEWVLEYLDRSAEHLLELEQEFKTGRNPKETVSAIADAFEMKTRGAGTVFSRVDLGKDIEWFMISLEVYKRIKEGNKEYIVIEDLAKENKRWSKSKIWRCWRRGKEFFDIEI